MFCTRLDFSPTKFLSSYHIFSIGFKSGDSAGVFHQLIPWSLMKSRAKLDVCLGSLFFMKRCELGNFSWMNGMSVWSRISVKSNLSIIPSKMQIPVWPLLEIPAHTCTFTECFALQELSVCTFMSATCMYNYRLHKYIHINLKTLTVVLALEFVPVCGNKTANVRIVDSSVQMTSSKPFSLYRSHHSKRFVLFAPLIS